MKRLNEILQRKVAAMMMGRFNPPTANHQKMIERLMSEAKNFGATPHVFVSGVREMEDNPLSADTRLKYLKMAMPHMAESFIYSENVLTVEDAIAHLVAEGYTDVVMLVPEEVDEKLYESIINFRGKVKSGESLSLESFNVVETYEKDPDSELAEGINTAQMRESAELGDFEKFKSGAMSGLSEKYVKELFDAVAEGMNSLDSLEEQIEQIPDSLNIPRSQMPQIKKSDIGEFINFLKTNGVKVEEAELEISKLKPTQNEINLNKVKIKHDDFKSNISEVKPFMVSNDNHILDGHHQLYALKSINGEMKVKAHKIDYPMMGIIDFAKKFPKTTYKSINEDQYATDLGYYKKRRALRKKSEIRRTREKQKKERQELRDKQFAEIQKARQMEYEKDKKSRGVVLDN
jgi:nicotinamide mononucleotide adenylyltransferase